MIDLSLHAPTSPIITHRRLAAGKHVPPFIFRLPPPSAPNLQDCKDSDVKVTNQDGKAHLHFSALSGDKKYACELDLCGEIDETESKIARTDRHVTLSLAKSTEGRWGKLVPGKAPQHVKVDWGRWVDSDDEDAMTAGPDLSGMEGLGGMGGGMGGGMFSVPPEKTKVVRVATVCLEYGKREPSPRIPYQLAALETFSEDPALAVLLEAFGRGEIPFKVAQAAAWNISSGLSWQRLAAEIIDRPGGVPDQQYFRCLDWIVICQ